MNEIYYVHTLVRNIISVVLKWSANTFWRFLNTSEFKWKFKCIHMDFSVWVSESCIYAFVLWCKQWVTSVMSKQNYTIQFGVCFSIVTINQRKKGHTDFLREGVIWGINIITLWCAINLVLKISNIFEGARTGLEAVAGGWAHCVLLIIIKAISAGLVISVRASRHPWYAHEHTYVSQFSLQEMYSLLFAVLFIKSGKHFFKI